MVNKRSISFFLVCTLIFFNSFAYADDASTAREADAAFKSKDYTTALSKYEALAENGNSGAQYNVGIFYLNGLGVQKDEKQAYAWLKKSAIKGNARAKQVIETAAAKGNLYASDALKELQQPTPALPAVASSNTNKPSDKERLVLLPISLDEEYKSRQTSIETALVGSLQKKFVVISGEPVSQKIRQISLKDSASKIFKGCNDTHCQREIAEAFQAKLVAIASASKEVDGDFLAVRIQNISDNKEVFSNSALCPKCNANQVADKFVELLNADANKRTAVSEQTSRWLSASANNTEEIYALFVADYPDGEYTSAAGDKIWIIIAQRESRKEIDNETVKSYRDFIQHNPKSKFIGLAKTKLKEALDNLSPDKPIGLYVGGQFGQVGSVTGVNSSTSLGGLFGYDINNTYSMELGYAALYRKTNANAVAVSLNAGSTGTFSLNSLSLVGQYAYHLSGSTKLLGGLGFHNSNYNLDSGSNNLLSGHSSGLVFVLKAEYDVTKNFGLRAGIDSYIMQGAIKGSVTNVGAAALFKF